METTLEEVASLPKKILGNLDGVGNLNVYAVQDFNLKLLNRIVNFGLDIFGEAGMDEWGLVPQISHGNVFIIKEENEKYIGGLAIFMRDWEEKDKCYLYDLAIREEFQGNSLGYHFLKIICEELKEHGFEYITLTVDVDNDPAIRLYRDKLGFEIVAEKEDYYGKDEHRYIMELDINKVLNS
ncbi:GNAT family N-acetyltransferase [Clostridiisalibacter paucivorans]|uniref:GNAT family N-acetyltransferase n=1 Tax=Clostridiisalibacter paucivorans TaxID=408753 RepID=UPI00047C58DE|nr:GNAT family N-acetyltransferase [Clostridiisalibacter paucivorans]